MSLLTQNADVALLFIALGVLGICAEFLRPGAVIFGVIGSMSVLFGFAGIGHVAWRGAVLTIIAAAFLVLDAKYSSRHLLSAAGALLLPLGVMVMNSRIHPPAAFLTMAPLALVASYLFRVARRARHNKAL